uniref:RxLR effector candidate protein n=1 Tax=Hyaloperonospora arabidopsidis (strain Emoy2) TaxID=559515 RepID=M4BCF5_HYAAE
MRPHFAVVLLTASLVATMDKAELLNQPSPPDRKHRDKPASVQGHVRGAVAVAKEERGHQEVLNQLAREINKVSLPRKFNVAFSAQDDQQLFPILEHQGAIQLDVLQAFEEEEKHIQKLVSTIRELGGDTRKAASVVASMEPQLFRMLMEHGWTYDKFAKGIMLDKPRTVSDKMKNALRYAIARAYMDHLMSKEAYNLIYPGRVE